MADESQEQLKLKYEWEKAKAGSAGPAAPNPLIYPEKKDPMVLGQEQPKDYMVAPLPNVPGLSGWKVDPEAMRTGAVPALVDEAMHLGEKSHWSKMGRKERDDFLDYLHTVPDDKKQAEIMRMVMPKGASESRKHRNKMMDRSPVSYGTGQALVGLPLGAAAGAVAGPSVAGQALAGGAIGALQGGSKESALSGAILGGGLTAAGKLAGAIGNGGLKAITNNADEMMISGLGYDSKEQLALQAVDDYWAQVRSLASKAGIGDEAGEQLAQEVLASKGILPPDGIGRSEVLDVGRNVVKFPYGAQPARSRIERGPIAAGSRGTAVKELGEAPSYEAPYSEMPENVTPDQIVKDQHPSSWINKQWKPTEIDLGPSQSAENELLSDFAGNSIPPDQMSGPGLYGRMSNADLVNMAPPGNPRPEPMRQFRTPMREPEQMSRTGYYDEPPPLDPASRSVSDKLGILRDKKETGLPISTLPGRIADSGLKRFDLAVGSFKPRAEKMLEMLNSEGFSKAASVMSGGAARLASLVNGVATSDDPELMDYLYKEMYPEYNLLSLAADKKSP